MELRRKWDKNYERDWKELEETCGSNWDGIEETKKGMELK